MTFTIPTLTTEHLTLRAPCNADLDAQASFFATERSHFVGGPKPIGGAWQFLTLLLGHWHMRGFGMWVMERQDTGEAIGVAGHYFPVGWAEREIGWHLWDQDLEGQGFAYEASVAAIAYGFEELKWNTQVSYITPDNSRSIKLAERLGAQLDSGAQQPDLDNPCLVYRHPAPEASQ